MSRCLATAIQQAVIRFSQQAVIRFRTSLSWVVSGAASQSQIDVAFNVHILVCRFLSSRLSSICSSSRRDFHFHQLAAAASVAVHAAYLRI